MRNQKVFALAVAVLTGTTLACNQSSTPLTTPAGAIPGAAGAGPDGGTLKVTAPTAVSPAGGVEVEDDDPDLVINNATAHYVENPQLSYVFEVFEEGQLVYRSNPVPAGPGGQTSHEVGVSLGLDETFTWRAYAVYQGHRGPMSADASFRTFNRFGESCSHLPTEHAIVECRRAQFGHMHHGERVEFLRRIAYDLNRGGFEHAPYGILQKTTGNNCDGYACDIICSDHEGIQRQWDVLHDEDFAQFPVWNRQPDIAVRVCEPVQ